MTVFSKLENMMQGAVEGPFNRLFRTHLEPVELANKLTRTMEANLQIGHDKKLAPNVYEVSLSRRDYTRFNAYAQSLQQQLSQILINVARERGYTLTSKPVIQFLESPSIGTGQARIQCHTVDPRVLPANAGQAGVPGLDETVSMSPEQAAALGQGGASPAQSPQAVPMPAAALVSRPARGEGRSTAATGPGYSGPASRHPPVNRRPVRDVIRDSSHVVHGAPRVPRYQVNRIGVR